MTPPRRRRSLFAVLALCAIGPALGGACSGGHSSGAKHRSTTSTAPRPTASGAAPSTTTASTHSTGSSPTISAAALPTTSTTTVASSASVRIANFGGPASPVECSAETMVELHWTTQGATTVEMHIDGGGAFTTYGNGTYRELLPLSCDGRSHTYELVARAGRAVATSSLTIATKRTS